MTNHESYLSSCEKRRGKVAEAEQMVQKFHATGGGNHLRFAQMIAKTRCTSQTWYNLGMASFDDKTKFIAGKLPMMNLTVIPFPQARAPRLNGRPNARATRIRDIIAAHGPIMLDSIVAEYKRLWAPIRCKTVWLDINKMRQEGFNVVYKTNGRRFDGGMRYDGTYTYIKEATKPVAAKSTTAEPLDLTELRKKVQAGDTALAKLLSVLSSRKQTIMQIGDELSRRYDLVMSDARVMDTIHRAARAEYGAFEIKRSNGFYWV